MDEELSQVVQEVGPQFIQQGAMQAAQEIQASGVSPEELSPILEMLRYVLQNPEAYPEIRAELVAQDFLDEEDLPEQFNGEELGILYLVLESALQMLSNSQPQMAEPQRFARGGLAKIADDLASMGRNGDTMLAHINPMEARLLQRMGGSGTINPVTGLPEFFLKKVFNAVKNTVKSVVNVAKDVVGGVTKAIGPAGTALLLGIAAPWAIPAIGGALGIGAIGAGALYGGATSALTGGDPVKGALMGGLGGGLGGSVGSSVNSGLGLGLSNSAQQVLGSSLVGGVAGAASGQGFGQGAIQGALGQVAGNALKGVAGNFSGALGSGIAQAGGQIANSLTAGYDPKSAIMSGGLSGLANALTFSPQKTDTFSGLKKPSDLVVDSLKAPQLGSAGAADFGSYGTDLAGKPMFTEGAGVDYSLANPGQNYVDLPTGTGMQANISQPNINIASSPSGQGFGLNDALKYGSLLATAGSLLNKPPQIQQQIAQLPADKQEYFNRPSIVWDWDRLQQDAMSNNTTLADYVSMNWPKITSGQYNVQQPVKLARGGALDSLSRYMRGGGSGRSDKIDAKLSPGEYVMDAETVALLGDGSSEEGARILDSMRSNLRKHKGKKLSKGDFSEDAKSPLDYIRGAL